VKRRKLPRGWDSAFSPLFIGARGETGVGWGRSRAGHPFSPLFIGARGETETLGRPWSPEAEAAWRAALVQAYGDAAEEELFCVPSRTSGAYMSHALVEACLDPEIPVLRWRCDDAFTLAPELTRHGAAEAWVQAQLEPVLTGIDPHTRCAVGLDFGRSGDLTVILPLVRRPDLTWRARCVVELRNVPFRQQEQVLFALLDRLPRFTAAMDARGNGQYLAEVAQQRYGTRVAPVMLSTEWYREQMPRYKAAFEDRTIALPRHADLLDDHRLLHVEKGIAKIPEGRHTTGSDGGQRHGDSAIAGALAVYATTLDWRPVEYTPAGRSVWRGGRDDEDEADGPFARREARAPALAFSGWRGSRSCGW
jgi:phage FluMu gp28-like protein